MSQFDTLKEHHQQKSLRSLPRYNAVEQYDVEPEQGLVGLVVALLIVAVVAGYAWGRWL